MRLIPLSFIFLTFFSAVSAQKIDSLIPKELLPIEGLKGKLFSLPDTAGIKKEIDKIKKVINNPASLIYASGEYNREPFIYPFDSSGYYFSEHSSINTEVTIAGIPISLGYKYLHFSAPLSGESVNNFSFKFDKDNYLQQLKNKLKTKYNPEQLLQSLKDDVFEKAKNKAIKLFQSEITEIKNKYKGSLNNVLAKAGNMKNIFDADLSTLTSLLLNPKFLETVRKSEINLTQIQEHINLGETINIKMVDSFRNILNQYKGIKEILQKIQEHKSKWLTTLLSEDFKSIQALKNRKIQHIINDPSSIRQLAHENLNLSGLQKFLLKVERLDLGQNALSLSPLSLQNFMSTGINAEFFNKNKYFMISAGQQPALNSIWDNPFLNNTFNSTNKVIGMRMGKGNLSSDSYSHFSLFSYQAGNSISPGIFDYELQRSTIVATISNKMKIGERGIINAEVSRSSMQYKNERNPLDSSITNKTALNTLFSGSDFAKSLAYSIAYSDEYPKIGLSHEIEIKSVSNGYYNPGNSFLPSGTKELKLNVKKDFFDRKLVINAKADLREFQFNDAIDRKWRNTNYSMDLRWKFKKGQYIGIRYQPLAMRRIENKVKYSINESGRLAIDGNIYKRIHSGLFYRHYLNLAYQRNKYQISSSDNIDSRSLLITSQQSIIIKKNVVFWNTSYNNVSNSVFFYFNTSLNSDAGFSYQLLKNFSASTSAGYRSIKNWYNQVAVRQTLSGQIGNHFSMNIYLDAGKNLKLIQALPYSPVRAEWSIKYMFNN